jgi:DinB superfamily
MKELSEALLRTIDFAAPKLRAVSDEESLKPALPGGWSRRQLIAHLIDSAANNHIRFVRASLERSFEIAGYDQNGNLRIQSPQTAPWPLLVDLFVSYNLYLAHVIAHIPPEKLTTRFRIVPHEPATLEFVANDYLRHLNHHLSQISIESPK